MTLFDSALALAIVFFFIFYVYAKFKKQTLSETFEQLKDALSGKPKEE